MIQYSCALMMVAALVVLLAVILVSLYFISKQSRKALDAINANQEMIRTRMESDRKLEKEKKLTGLTLQAYERVALFLERINPVNMIPRLLKPGINAGQFENLLASAIREEYEHNMSQQLYISDAAWERVKLAKENILNLISTSAAAIKGSDPASELAREILTKGIDNEIKLVDQALSAIKAEMLKNF